MSVPVSRLSKYIKVLRDNDVAVTYWDRVRAYGKNGEIEAIENCDTFIIVFPSNEFKMYQNQIPSGSYSEYLRAVKLGKRIVLGYDSSEGIKFYETEVSSNILTGIAGTGHTFLQDMINLKDRLKGLGIEIPRDKKGFPVGVIYEEEVKASMSTSDKGDLIWVDNSVSMSKEEATLWWGPPTRDRRLLLL